MITRIRNANLRKSRKVDVLRTNLTVSIALILKQEGFIESFEESGSVFLKEKGILYKYISIVLKYKGVKQKPYITGIKKISNPGLRVYVNQSCVPRVLGGVGIAVFSSRFCLGFCFIFILKKVCFLYSNINLISKIL